MSERWWYLRRGIAWSPLLGCCAVAAVVSLLLARWPGTALVLLPALLACCAASSSFVFDEPASPVVEVTPRGAGWRRTTRLAVAAVPLAVWVGVVALRPGDLPLQRSGWWLVGAAGVGLAAGAAALASRRHVPAPGASLAAIATLTALGPIVVTAFLGTTSPYPVAGFPDGVRVFWAAVAVAALVACATALRPGVHS